MDADKVKLVFLYSQDLLPKGVLWEVGTHLKLRKIAANRNSLLRMTSAKIIRK